MGGEARVFLIDEGSRVRTKWSGVRLQAGSWPVANGRESTLYPPDAAIPLPRYSHLLLRLATIGCHF